MELINDLKQYSSLVSTFRKKYQGLFTNCFLLPGKIQQYITRRSLWFDERDTMLLFISNEVDYYNLYYFFPMQTVKESKHISLFDDKPVLLELAGSDIAWDEKYQNPSTFWLQSGFKEFASFHRMKADTNNVFQLEGAISRVDADFSIIYPDESSIPAILSLWRNELPVIGNTFPYGDEMKAQLENKQVVIIMDRANQIAATMHFIPQGSTCMVKHVVVSESYRRRGLARAIYGKYFLTHPEYKTCLLWVEDSNLDAIRLYESLGFKTDGMISRQYIFQ